MNKTTQITVGIIVLALVIWAISASVGGKKEASGEEPIRIGVATILSGSFAAGGENIVKATKLAVQEINDGGGINGSLIELFVEDSGWDSQDGLNASQKLINVDNVRYIINGMSSNGTLSSAPLADETKTVMLKVGTGGQSIDDAGEYTFRTANSDLLAGRDIARAMFDLGFIKTATVAEVTEYTLGLQDTFEKEMKNLGGEVVISESFQPDTTDFRTLVSKIKEKEPQAILIASQTGISGAHFVNQSKELGLNGPFFSDFTFVTNQDAKTIVGSLDGIYFADAAYDAESSATKDFFSKYEEVYEISPLIPFHAAASYDAVMMLRDAIDDVGDDSEKVHDWLLENVKNRKGLMGTFSLDKDGNSNLGFVVKIVKDGAFVEIE